MQLIRVNRLVLTVDPGVHTAAALWRDSKPTRPIAIFKFNAVVKGREPVDLADRLEEIIKGCTVKPKLVIIEQVEFWASSAKSMASASRGNLALLAYIVGAMVSTCQRLGVETELISPLKWKGQLPYKVLRRILETKYGIETTSDHEASAIGIGLNHYGLF